MPWQLVVLIVVVALLLVALALTVYCFFHIFYVRNRKPLGADEYEIPEGEVYEARREELVAYAKRARALPREDVSVRSKDGLTLRGYYYHGKDGAPIEILFHGYRGDGERDLSGGIERSFRLGHNVLIVDHRAGGRSDGNVTTFGIKERFDCLCWIEFAIEKFGKDVEIIIGGVSMGASTVMMAAGEPIPKNVLFGVADCGFTSPKEIIQKVITEMRLPAKILYPFVWLSARLFGGFNLEECSPLEAVRRANIPLVFIHGDTDDFVPFEMSERLYAACASPKKFQSIEGAGHGLAYPANKEQYLQALRDFEAECRSNRENA